MLIVIIYGPLGLSNQGYAHPPLPHLAFSPPVCFNIPASQFRELGKGPTWPTEPSTTCSISSSRTPGRRPPTPRARPTPRRRRSSSGTARSPGTAGTDAARTRTAAPAAAAARSSSCLGTSPTSGTSPDGHNHSSRRSHPASPCASNNWIHREEGLRGGFCLLLITIYSGKISL